MTIIDRSAKQADPRGGGTAGKVTMNRRWLLQSRADLRRTAAFKRLAREAGLLTYWRARDWPDLCRPRGEDFDCD